MNEIKSISAKEREFMANGKRYIILNKITPKRYKEYEKLVPRLTFGLDFQEIYKNLEKAYAFLNKQKFADASVVIHNTMSGIADANSEKRIQPAMMMAALVIVREGENPATFDETLMLDKINDWEEEGLDMMSFFELSLNSIQGFKETLLRFTQAQMEIIEEEEEKKKK